GGGELLQRLLDLCLRAPRLLLGLAQALALALLLRRGAAGALGLFLAAAGLAEQGLDEAADAEDGVLGRSAHGRFLAVPGRAPLISARARAAFFARTGRRSVIACKRAGRAWAPMRTSTRRARRRTPLPEPPSASISAGTACAPRRSRASSVALTL